MRRAGSTRVALALAGAVAVAVGAGAFVLLRERPPVAGPPPRPSASLRPDPADAPPRRAAPVTSEDALVEREDEGGVAEVAVPTSLADALADAATGFVARRSALAAHLAEARAGRLHPVDLGTRLHELVGRRPELGALLVDELVAERDPAIALKLAQALAATLDDDPVRRQTVEALRRAPPEARVVGLLALLGRADPDVTALSTASFRDDAPEARATAGFLLNQTPGGVPARDAPAVAEAARAALRDASAPSRLREEALSLLARPPGDEDLALLERALLEAPEPAVRARAFRALVEGGAPPARVRVVLQQALSGTGLPDEVREAIRAVLAR